MGNQRNNSTWKSVPSLFTEKKCSSTFSRKKAHHNCKHEFNHDCSELSLFANVNTITVNQLAKDQKCVTVVSIKTSSYCSKLWTFRA